MALTAPIVVCLLALGVLGLAETFSWNEPNRALLVLLGILLNQKRLRCGSFGSRRRQAVASA